MERARALALQNVLTGKGGPFGAVVVRAGEILGEGTNAVTTIYDPTAHAEVMAIRAACRRLESHSLDGCEIYCSCEPCPMCLAAIYWARCDRIYYDATSEDAAAIGFDDALFYKEIRTDPAMRRVPMRRLPAGDREHEPFLAWRLSTLAVAY